MGYKPKHSLHLATRKQPKGDPMSKDAIEKLLDGIAKIESDGDPILGPTDEAWHELRKLVTATREQYEMDQDAFEAEHASSVNFARKVNEQKATIAALKQRVEELEGWYNANESRLQKFEELTKIHGLTDPVDELANAFQKHIDEIRRVFELWKGAKEQLDWFLNMKERRIKELEAKTTLDVTATEGGKASTEAVGGPCDDPECSQIHAHLATEAVEPEAVVPICPNNRFGHHTFDGSPEAKLLKCSCGYTEGVNPDSEGEHIGFAIKPGLTVEVEKHCREHEHGWLKGREVEYRAYQRAGDGKWFSGWWYVGTEEQIEGSILDITHGEKQ